MVQEVSSGDFTADNQGRSSHILQGPQT